MSGRGVGSLRATAPAAGGRYGFTLIELMVSVALLVAVILMVAQIFDISTRAASRTNAQAEVFAGAAAFRERITADVSRMLPGFLVIDSPPPTPVRAEVPGGEAVFRLRQDRLIFVAGGAAGQYESLTDPTRGEPDGNAGAPSPAFPLRPSQWAPTSTSAALMYYGPSEPMDAAGNPRQLDLGSDPRPPTASEWVFVNRALLLGSDANTGVGYFGNSPPAGAAWRNQYVQWKAMLDADAITFQNSLVAAGALTVPNNFLNGSMDVFFRATPSGTGQISGTEFIDRINTKLTGLGLGSFPGSLVENLWQLGRAPVTATLRDPTAFDYYKRNGANFMPRMADIRIEWTDGRSIDPPPPFASTVNPDMRTRWFGLKSDPTVNPNPANGTGLNSSLTYFGDRRSDANVYYTTAPAGMSANDFTLVSNSYNRETNFFNNQIESSTSNGANAAYRAVWRKDNWQFRPKALRITYRLFDARNKLESDATVDLDDDDRPDPEGGATPYVLKRYGQEFSVVIPVP